MFIFGVEVLQAGIYLFKVNNRNIRTMCEICLKLTIKTPERRHWRRYGILIINFEHISHFVLVNFELVNADWVYKHGKRGYINSKIISATKTQIIHWA